MQDCHFLCALMLQKFHSWLSVGSRPTLTSYSRVVHPISSKLTRIYLRFVAVASLIVDSHLLPHFHTLNRNSSNFHQHLKLRMNLRLLVGLVAASVILFFLPFKSLVFRSLPFVFEELLRLKEISRAVQDFTRVTLPLLG